MKKSAPSYIANFDSASAMLRAIAYYLRGKDFPALGLSPLLKPIGPMANLLPKAARERVYALGGWNEAVPPRQIRKVRAEELSEWVVSEYPERPYQAIAIGSSSGALVHVWTALGIPWLPQTFLIPLRHSGIHPDEPAEAMEYGIESGKELLENNPELQLHHMHDANQDRLMLEYMTYFRVKRLRLGAAYEYFIKQTLAPGGTIIVAECQRTWPTTRIGERHYFQHGALGGATVEEFMHGSERVEEYLARYGSHRRKWEGPEPNDHSPEAEWGFIPELRDDIEDFARRNGYRVARLTFEEPEHPSPLAAELHRWWFRARNIPANRLLAESFIVMEPYWAMRTGSVPFWMKFNMETSADWLEHYLQSFEPYDEVYLMLFAHGVECVGLPPIERWRDILSDNSKKSGFMGIDKETFPRDFATFARYHDAVRTLPARYPLPGYLTLRQFEDFLEQHQDRFPVAWHASKG